MDEITKRVKDMYERYPFPSCNMINKGYGNRIKGDLKNRGFNIRKLKILEAGCGTGEKAISLAKVFTDSEITGWDISSTSIGKAKELARQEDVKNINFENINLLDDNLSLSYKNYFDIIIAWGVIHHLSDPIKGLRNLGACLKMSGYIYVWLYALYSLERIETRLAREAIDILLKEEGFSYDKGLKIINAIKSVFKILNYGGKKDYLMHLKWFFDKNVDKKQIILHVIRHIRKIKFSSDYDVNMVDAFLHENVKDYSVRMVFEEIEKANLEIVDFLEPSPKIEDFVKSDYVKNIYYSLDFNHRMEVMERILKPGNLLFLARRKI